MASRTKRNPTLDLFADGRETLFIGQQYRWPDQDRVPLNLARGRSVRRTVEADLMASSDPLIVTGFAGLDEIIELVAAYPVEKGIVRVLLGHEPFASRRDEYRLSRDAFTEEVQDYWLDRGISLLRSSKLVAVMNRLREGQVRARYLANGGARLHAKIYCGNDAVTLGSSNYTRPGLDSQVEANVRFVRAQELQRHDEVRDVAENYWSAGVDYNDALCALLEQLLKVVDWREALARACAELLEGEWAQVYLDLNLPGASELWPSQRQGIAQALYILARQGSLLIADATGSGKTRMGSHLLRALTDQLLRSGRMRHGMALMVSPPAVGESWRDEAHAAGASLQVYSHGTLSHGRSVGHDRLISSLRQAQVLCVDEGHNFLNIASQRSQHLLRNMADHVLVFTATPINRSVADLLRIADLLGADNLDPSVLGTFQRMLGRSRLDRNLTEEERDTLRAEIKRFTVRRTKRLLNDLIEKEPDAYVDARGERCRFPQHVPQVYALGEPALDRALAREIGELADQLLGVTHFQKTLELPEVLRSQGLTESQYLTNRLRSAKRLARYIIMASLRSSRAALIEHIEGTEQARKHVNLDRYGRKKGTGDMLRRIDEIAGRLPTSRMTTELPDWLRDEAVHRAACARERRIYAHIFRLVAQMSDQRERAKARKLAELSNEHRLVLAFDSRPITLAVVEQFLRQEPDAPETLVATGETAAARARLLREFAPGSSARNLVGLCSDSLSEGVNLQQASCIVHLDMPSVVRIAEQRVGRVDRMDSPHTEIQAWWPDDAEEFALSTDDRFIERYETVENLLGSNLPLPEEMQGERRIASVSELISEFEAQAEAQQWDGIDDAFQSVRDLVSGDEALVAEATYEHYRKVTSRVLSRVSLVRADRPWAFFCLAAGAGGAPRWVFLPSSMSEPVLELDAVCESLRERLQGETESLAMDEHAETTLHRFLDILGRAERRLLSRRKQRAIEEMERVIEHFLTLASSGGESETVEHLDVLLRALRSKHPGQQPDWDEVAARWLELIRPVWYERLKAHRKKPLLLKDIRKDLYARKDELVPALVERFARFPVQAPPDERVRACIIGVPPGSGSLPA